MHRQIQSPEGDWTTPGADRSKEAKPVSDQEHRSGPPPTRRGGHPFGEAASALQKALRRCDTDGALYWAAELDRSGYGAYVWRRLTTICSEEIGAVEAHLPATIEALRQWWQDTRAREGKRDRTAGALYMAHAVVLLARARKSRTTHDAMIVHWLSDEVREPPDWAIDKHTLRGRQIGRGFDHFFETASLLVDPETGELSPEGSEANPYRDAARAAFERGRQRDDRPDSVAERVQQLRLGEEER